MVFQAAELWLPRTHQESTTTTKFSQFDWSIFLFFSTRLCRFVLKINNINNNNNNITKESKVASKSNWSIKRERETTKNYNNNSMMTEEMRSKKKKSRKREREKN